MKYDSQPRISAIPTQVFLRLWTVFYIAWQLGCSLSDDALCIVKPIINLTIHSRGLKTVKTTAPYAIKMGNWAAKTNLVDIFTSFFYKTAACYF